MVRSFFLSFGCVICALSLSGCQDIIGPNALPDGYVHHTKQHRVDIPHRPEIAIGEVYSDEEAARSDALWRAAVSDLLTELEEKTLYNGMTLSVEPGVPTNSFQTKMDFYVRSLVRERGFMVLANRRVMDMPALHYAGYKIEDSPVYEDVMAAREATEGKDHRVFRPRPTHGNETEIYLSLEIRDPVADAEAIAMDADFMPEPLVRVEGFYPILTKDLNEINDYLPIYDFIVGTTETSIPR